MSNTANTGYGSGGGPSAGLGDNVEKDLGEREQKGGIKGITNKIVDKMNPSHTQPAQQVSLFIVFALHCISLRCANSERKNANCWICT